MATLKSLTCRTRKSFVPLTGDSEPAFAHIVPNPGAGSPVAPAGDKGLRSHRSWLTRINSVSLLGDLVGRSCCFCRLVSIRSRCTHLINSSRGEGLTVGGSDGADDRRRRRRKVAAVLAGGLVVGVGTMATLASWNDTEYVGASFVAGSFNLQGSTDQTTFGDHAEAPQIGALAFTAPVGALTPGDTVYAGYALRLDKTSTNAGKVTISAPASTGTVTDLTYTLFTTSSAGCSATADPVTTVVPAGTALGSVESARTFTVAKPTDSSTDGAPTYLCFKITAGSGLQQGQQGTATWLFTATSI